MPPKKRASAVKKIRRKALSAHKGKAQGTAARLKTAPSAHTAVTDIKSIDTLEGYKRLVAKACTEATSEPENGLHGVKALFDVVAGRGGGTAELKEYASVLALRSMVAVAVHLIPRISYELLDEEDEGADQPDGKGATSDKGATTSAKQKAAPASKAKKPPTMASSLVETERTISKQVVELRDMLVKHCSNHLNKKPELIVPLVARLSAAETKPNPRLIRLCAECCNIEDEGLAQVCLGSITEVLEQSSIRDLEKIIPILLKTNRPQAALLRAINSIPLARKQHSYKLISEKEQTADKHIEEILTSVIAFYLRILAQCTGEMLEECLKGLSRMGALVNETLQKEILAKMKTIILSATSLRPATHVRVLQAAASLSRVLQAQSHWILQELARMVQNTAPYLCQGEAMQDGEYVHFSEPCYTWDVIRTVQVVISHSASVAAAAEMEDLVKLVQQLLALCLVCDSAAAEALIREVAKVIDRVPQIAGVIEPDGMIFSVLAKRATSFWEIELMCKHVAPQIADTAKELKRQAVGGAPTRNKAAASTHRKASARDLAACGSDVDADGPASPRRPRTLGHGTMNFIKGIVDGILAEDADTDDRRSGGYRAAHGGPRAEHDLGLRHTDALARELDSVYRDERRNCITSLIVRYGEGCVQQLNELLKTNNRTIADLAKQLDDAYRSLGDFNSDLEELSQENVALRRRNAELENQLELLNSENVSLKSLVEQAEIEAKSQERRIGGMAELLKQNAVTFDDMRDRCTAVAEYAAQIESLKAQLSVANSHIEALTKERDALVEHAPEDEHRIKEAMRKQDRALSIAKLMAQEASYLSAQNVQLKNQPRPETSQQQLSQAVLQAEELRTHVEKLNDENGHLKDVNEKLHNMYADLSKSSKQLKDSFLAEAIQALGTRHLKQLTPVQLVFIQPTRVLDLDLDLDFVRDELARSMRSPYQQSNVHMDSRTFDVAREAHVMRPVAAEPATPASPNVAFGTVSQLRTPQPAPAYAESVTPTTRQASPHGSMSKNSWDDDFDLYDEILHEEHAAPEEPQPQTAVSAHASPILEPLRTPVQPTPTTPVTLAADVKLDLTKSKGAWDDDLDELLNEQ
ncbi:cingulin 1-like protein, putative [Babesia ovata]|uniref:Cingulin 1-like protein, putative n=1 Tax=Babesia ovata TaxID=189622 RepID=A0A2H6KFM7_9APIC|nr:cingulin 1-like protein, putative [Babesia ovata]GBE61803.1 cingulin 1-like protein, putative [Babesia ovata]